MNLSVYLGERLMQNIVFVDTLLGKVKTLENGRVMVHNGNVRVRITDGSMTTIEGIFSVIPDNLVKDGALNPG